MELEDALVWADQVIVSTEDDTEADHAFRVLVEHARLVATPNIEAAVKVHKQVAMDNIGWTAMTKAIVAAALTPGDTK